MDARKARRSIRRLGAWVLLASALVACADEAPVAPRVSSSETISAVTPDVAAQLDASGRFVFSYAHGAAPEISEERARELAIAIWSTYGTLLPRVAERTREAPVARTLKVCPRAYYAQSGYEPFPAETPSSIRRAYGNTWLIGLCLGREQQVAMSIAAEATNLTINSDGVVTNARGGDFSVVGVPVGTEIPVAPEVAVVRSSRGLSVRISGVPVLRRSAQRTDAALSAWYFPTEGPVLVEGADSHVDRSVSGIAFAFQGGWQRLGTVDADPTFVAESRDETIVYRISPTVTQQVIIRRRLDTPFRFEAVARVVE